MKVDVTTPEAVHGRCDRRPQPPPRQDHGPRNAKGVMIVQAEVPLSEMFGYSTQLRSLTSGRATYVMEPSHFERVPQKSKKKLLRK